MNSDNKKWQPILFDLVNKEILPKHYGGELVDEEDDPKCAKMVNLIHFIIKHYYWNIGAK